jgi:hypothetical protein
MRFDAFRLYLHRAFHVGDAFLKIGDLFFLIGRMVSDPEARARGLPQRLDGIRLFREDRFVGEERFIGASGLGAGRVKFIRLLDRLRGGTPREKQEPQLRQKYFLQVVINFMRCAMTRPNRQSWPMITGRIGKAILGILRSLSYLKHVFCNITQAWVCF